MFAGSMRRLDPQLPGVGCVLERQCALPERKAVVAHGTAVEDDAHILLLLAVERKRRMPVLRLRARIAPEAERRRDDRGGAREIELERDRVDQKRRRPIVEAAPDLGSEIARKHLELIGRRVTSRRAARRRRPASRSAG